MLVALHSLSETKALASMLARYSKKGDVIALKGDLGAGKTAFSRYFIQSFLGEEAEVPSPTFTLVQTYDTPTFLLWHFDLYRLSKPEEAIELAIEDAFSDGVSLIEWPEIIVDWLPKQHLTITLQRVGEAEERVAVIEGHTRWDPFMQMLSSSFGG